MAPSLLLVFVLVTNCFVYIICISNWSSFYVCMRVLYSVGAIIYYTVYLNCYIYIMVSRLLSYWYVLLRIPQLFSLVDLVDCSPSCILTDLRSHGPSSIFSYVLYYLFPTFSYALRVARVGASPQGTQSALPHHPPPPSHRTQLPAQPVTWVSQTPSPGLVSYLCVCSFSLFKLTVSWLELLDCTPSQGPQSMLQVE